MHGFDCDCPKCDPSGWIGAEFVPCTECGHRECDCPCCNEPATDKHDIGGQDRDEARDLRHEGDE